MHEFVHGSKAISVVSASVINRWDVEEAEATKEKQSANLCRISGLVNRDASDTSGNKMPPLLAGFFTLLTE